MLILILVQGDIVNLDFLKWIGHASFIAETSGKKIYVDPFRLRKGYGHADIILISHPHYDHLSIEDIKKIADSSTEFFIPKDSISKLSEYKNVTGVEPNSSYETGGIRFSTIPSYNIVKEKLQFHPKANGWVGYILSANNMSIYHAGDTDFIEEMKGLNVDLALIPMGGTYTMDLNDAVRAAKGISAKHVIPMHYKALLGEKGSKEAEETFKKSVKNSIILNEIQEPIYAL